MELKDFIAKTLTEIQNGISDANKNGIRVSDTTAKEIQFDISVTTNSADESKIGAGIFVAGIGLGANNKEQVNNSAINRIKFSLPLFIENKDD
ncbi:hypothetical protein RM553_19300 [Zunongwangia sp. F363]|uniref:Uncharacterized protein n=1 Tax=Autumnicola tepida TaxID=3075595 RepID=A0ABU3CF56_9FLAO|nr:hypothetical protein [Zunongwangia sp. F363]MDT0644988.1 hypothetical protein [Zunongwangia sp. F363]